MDQNRNQQGSSQGNQQGNSNADQVNTANNVTGSSPVQDNSSPDNDAEPTSPKKDQNANNLRSGSSAETGGKGDMGQP